MNENLQAALAVQNEIKGRFAKSRNTIIAQLIQHYRSGQLDNTVLLVGKIAELSMLEQMLQEIEREIKSYTGDQNG